MDPLSASVVERRVDLLSRSSAALFERFLNGRRYLKNVTADTIEWYQTTFKAFCRAMDSDAPPNGRGTAERTLGATRQRLKPGGVRYSSCPAQRQSRPPWRWLPSA
jgi:hypothetical protein